jgi:hypothetical protein
MVKIDVVTVTAYKCEHCDQLFPDSDAALKHLEKCPARTKSYTENNSDSGNMILKEGD